MIMSTRSAQGGHVAVTALDLASGDATLMLFGLQACHDRSCDHAVYDWADPTTSLKPFGNNPILGMRVQVDHNKLPTPC
eukprot:COSAG01_NODE_510_length_16076_cov_102.088252_10_plen_79_part_00